MNNQDIIELKEKIHDLKEYLQSDICRSCGETVLQLDQYISQLENILKGHDTNS